MMVVSIWTQVICDLSTTEVVLVFNASLCNVYWIFFSVLLGELSLI